VITGTECVETSYPRFVEQLGELNHD
jgi:5-enolpyruvylshikimate-3-phosphate synthase